MKFLPALALSAIGLALVLASPAEAAKSSKHKKSAATHSVKHHHAAYVAGGAAASANGVLSGPLYNGQDYIGDDPDPNIRSYLIRDMTRYRGAY